MSNKFMDKDLGYIQINKKKSKTNASIRGVDGRDQPQGGRDRAITLTNLYQKELLEAIDKFSLDIENTVKAIPEASKVVVEKVISERLPKFQDKLIEISEAKIREGFALGHRRSKREPGLAAKRALEERLARNRQYLTESFIPDLRAKMIANIGGKPLNILRRQYQFDPFLLIGAIASMRARLASYSGEVWEAIFSSAKISGQEADIERMGKGLKPRRVRWELDAGSQHCKERPDYHGCPDLAKEYDSWDAMPTVPGGKVSCLTNCRCSISIQNEDGSWDMAI